MGVWIAETEGAKFWLSIVTELQTRGVEDVFIACVDTLKGFPEAIEAVFPRTQVQLCLVHLLRHSLSYVSYKERKEVAADLKLIYTAATLEEAETRLLEFAGKWETRYPVVARSRSRELGADRLDVRFHAGNPAGDLHDQRHRIAELQPAEDHQKPRFISERRSGL